MPVAHAFRLSSFAFRWPSIIMMITCVGPCVYEHSIKYSLDLLQTLILFICCICDCICYLSSKLKANRFNRFPFNSISLNWVGVGCWGVVVMGLVVRVAVFEVFRTSKKDDTKPYCGRSLIVLESS